MQLVRNDLQGSLDKIRVIYRKTETRVKTECTEIFNLNTLTLDQLLPVVGIIILAELNKVSPPTIIRQLVIGPEHHGKLLANNYYNLIEIY